MHLSSSLLGVATLALALSSRASAQETTADAKVIVSYVNNNNDVLGTDELAYNTCTPSENAFNPYAYINFNPNNATINFYKDSGCKDVAFGIVGYYGGYPGVARSLQWTGFSMESRGELFEHQEINAGTQNPGGNNQQSGNPGNPTPNNGGNHSPAPGGQNPPATPNNQEGKKEESTSSTFFGGVVGSMVVLSIGGVIFWKTAGKKMVADKGKGVLPSYGRVGGNGRDGDILLTSNNARRDQNSFELGDEYEDDDEDDDRHRRERSGRGGRYHDDDDQV